MIPQASLPSTIRFGAGLWFTLSMMIADIFAGSPGGGATYPRRRHCIYNHLSQCPRDIRRLPRSSRGCPWLGSPATSSSDGLPLRPRAAPRRAHGPLLPHDGLGRGRRRRCPGDHGARLAPGSVASRSALRCAPGSPASPRACASTRWPIARGGCARSSWRAPARSTIPSPSCREGAGWMPPQAQSLETA